MSRVYFSLFIYFFSCSLCAFEVLTPLKQGALVYLRVNEDAQVYFNKRKVSCHKGVGVVGISKDATEASFDIIQNEKKQNFCYPIQPVEWSYEVVNGLPKSKVVLSKKDAKRVSEEAELLYLAREKVLYNGFPRCFIRPTDRRVSSAFGSYRVLNGIKGASHGGTDYAIPKGEEIKVSASGLVRVVHQDMFYSGKTVLIDHGGGIFSSYSHLNEIFVKENEVVQKGEIVGTSGSSGRATGPHLHYSFFWFNTRLDPEDVFKTHTCEIDF